jgi:hypothetical protein
MAANNSERLRPELDEAQKRLESALEEACGADVSRANTGELIRIEEVLAIANEAAKQAVSVRRRLGAAQNTSAADEHAEDHARDAGAASSAESHRVFEDVAGTRWTAFAVYPSPATASRASLRGTFQKGWLAFDSSVETRRLTPVPDDWRTLSDDGLRELCLSAQPATRRRRHPGGSGDAQQQQ